MTNHVHLIAVPKTEESLALGIGWAHHAYTRRINFRENWRGYLWQGRFYSCPLDEAHAERALGRVLRRKKPGPAAPSKPSRATRRKGR